MRHPVCCAHAPAEPLIPSDGAAGVCEGWASSRATHLAAHDLAWLTEKVAAGWFDALEAAEAMKRDRAGLSGGAMRH